MGPGISTKFAKRILAVVAVVIAVVIIAAITR